MSMMKPPAAVRPVPLQLSTTAAMRHPARVPLHSKLHATHLVKTSLMTTQPTFPVSILLLCQAAGPVIQWAHLLHRCCKS